MSRVEAKKAPPPPNNNNVVKGVAPGSGRKDSGTAFSLSFRKGSNAASTPPPASVLKGAITPNSPAKSSVFSSTATASRDSNYNTPPDFPTLRPSRGNSVDFDSLRYSSTTAPPPPPLLPSGTSSSTTTSPSSSANSSAITSSSTAINATAPAVNTSASGTSTTNSSTSSVDPMLRPSTSNSSFTSPVEPVLRPSAVMADQLARPRLSLNNFIQKLPIIMEQLDNNLSFLARIIAHIKKVVATREAYAMALAKEWGAFVPKSKIATVLATSVPRKSSDDAPRGRLRSASQTTGRSPPLPAAPAPPAPPPFSATGSVRGKNPLPLLMQKMESMAEMEGSQVSNFCIQCRIAVVSPLERLKETLEEAKRKIERDDKDRRLKFDETKMRDKLHRKKQKCDALWMNLQGMHKNRADPRKIQKFLGVIRSKFSKYEQMVNSYNAACEAYYAGMPALIQTLQRLEYERIDTMRNVLRQYSLFWHQLYSEPAREAEAMLVLLDDPTYSTHEQKEYWLETLNQQQTPAKNWDGSTKSSEIPTATFDLPCSPQELIPGFGTDPTRGPYVHKFDTVLRAVLQAQQKENVVARFSVDDYPQVSRHTDKHSDDEAETKHPDEPESPEPDGKAEDNTQGDIALAIYKQMFGCEPGELGHPILAESEEEEESSESSEEEEDDD